ncbi:NUDIX domain-containing protein [Flavobacteriaceae bacterium AU392]|nr:CoA pyrophosphatase [Flavobacteriaceae bacterium]RKM83623.1 NUDIX domain-containing protein [Flavobacteriaceae bacterium AU392]
MEFKKFLERISKNKTLPLPGEVSQLKMSPPFRKKLLEEQKDKIKEAKRAGVIALFYPDNRELTKLVLILRKTYEGVHSAQIGFPGGKYENGDKTIKDTAIRETFEEIGVPITQIEIIKELTQVYIPPSNFYVQPFLGILKDSPEFIKQEDEVELIIEVNLDDLLDEKVVATKSVPTSYNKNIKVPTFTFNNYIVWGATAMILSEIKDLLKEMQ